MSRADDIAAADAALSALDPVMADLVQRFGPCLLPLRPVAGGYFGSLAGAILYQQLAGKAAAAIHARFVACFEDATPTPGALLGLADDALRGVGLSANKVAAIRDLAQRIADGRLRLDRVEEGPDPEIIAALSEVRGIGRWTAEMFLIFTLGRLDVWPADDYGVRTGYARAYGLTGLPKPKELTDLGERYRPWRSVAAWYCWRAVES